MNGLSRHDAAPLDALQAALPDWTWDHARMWWWTYLGRRRDATVWVEYSNGQFSAKLLPNGQKHYARDVCEAARKAIEEAT